MRHSRSSTPLRPQSNVTLSTSTVTRDLAHRFFEHQMQIDGGKNDGYAAWSDAGGLAMGHYDYSQSALYALAREFVLADNFFQGAFGGSFLNHQYLICACAPVYPNADTAAAKPSIAILDRDAAGQYSAAAQAGQERDLGPGWTSQVREERQYRAGRLFRRRQILRREYHATRLSAERQYADRGRCRPALCRSEQCHYLAAPDSGDHRRCAGRQARRLGLVFGRLGRGARRRPPPAARDPAK